MIGSRNLAQFPQVWIDLYREAARKAAVHGHTVVTGAAEGADQLAAETALAAGGKVELVLPWGDFNQEWVQSMIANYGTDRVTTVVYVPLECPDWTQSVYDYHPACQNGKMGLEPGAFRLHARNYGIVYNSQTVIALPGRKFGGGGTAQGLRVAYGLRIRRFDLSDKQGRDALAAMLNPPVRSSVQCP
jgi:hypothetical protein